MSTLKLSSALLPSLLLPVWMSAGTAFADGPVTSNPGDPHPDPSREFDPGPGFLVTSNHHFIMADAATKGCIDPPVTGDCLRFATMDDVYLTAGKPTDGLADGRYFFTVIAPGYQDSGYADGAEGNLSDRVMGGTAGDDGSGDAARDRIFEVKNHEIVAYKGPHILGQAADSRTTLSVGPFDESPNMGGVYVLAICPVGVKLPQQCSYDAFRVGFGLIASERAIVAGRAYYDANVNGRLDQGELMMDDAVVRYWDSVQGVEHIATDGGFAMVVKPDDLVLAMGYTGRNWMVTGNHVSQAVVVGEGTVDLIEDMSYAVSVSRGAAVDGVQFGNVCLGDGGAQRLGYWASSIALKDLGQDDLKLLSALNLRGKDGRPYDPSTIQDLQRWLRAQSTVHVHSRLSAQLAVAALNVHNDYTQPAALGYMPDTETADHIGFGALNDLMGEANELLANDDLLKPYTVVHMRGIAVNDALMHLNGNETFVQAVPISCAPDADHLDR